MVNFPKYSNVIDIIESVFFINEWKYPIIYGQCSVPNSLNPVDGTINY